MNSASKYIVSISVLFISLIILGCLVSLCVVETKGMTEAVQRVEALKRKIRELNKQSPVPSQENADRISADAEIIDQKTEELQQFFGKPYSAAVDVLVKELGLTREEFFPMWRKAFEEETKRGNPRELIFKRFFAKFPPIKAEKAIAAFAEKVRERSVEPLDNQFHIEKCIMEALGVPRKMEPIPTKKYMMDMQDNLTAYMMKEKCKSCGKLITREDFDETLPECRKCYNDPGQMNFIIFGKGIDDDPVKRFTFEKFDGVSLPRPDEVSYIVKHFKLIEDLLFRIKDSGIEQLNSISKDNLKGETRGDYMVFTYEIEVTGPQDSIMQLIKNLQRGYRDNRIYRIKSLTLKSESGAAKNIVHKSTEYRALQNGRREEVPVETGVVIVGKKDSIKAKIKFDYFIYIGDELTEND